MILLIFVMDKGLPPESYAFIPWVVGIVGMYGSLVLSFWTFTEEKDDENLSKHLIENE